MLPKLESPGENNTIGIPKYYPIKTIFYCIYGDLKIQYETGLISFFQAKLVYQK